jgi:hypothetical protein
MKAGAYERAKILGVQKKPETKLEPASEPEWADSVRKVVREALRFEIGDLLIKIAEALPSRK